MLKVRRLKRYRTAKYPRHEYISKEPGPADELLKLGGTSILLLALMENSGCAVTGPPPVDPDMITENEARQIITQVFDENGITLDEDYQLVLRSSANDSILFNVDGFNDSLQVGYEYFAVPNDNPFDQTAYEALNDSAQASGPYVKTLDEIPRDVPYRDLLERRVEAFIDSLKAHGII